MTINLNLPQDLISALEAKAARSGQNVEECASNLLREALEDSSSPKPRGAEWAHRLRDWGKKFARKTNGRLDDSRDSIYPDPS